MCIERSKQVDETLTKKDRAMLKAFKLKKGKKAILKTRVDSQGFRWSMGYAKIGDEVTIVDIETMNGLDKKWTGVTIKTAKGHAYMISEGILIDVPKKKARKK